MRKWVDDLGMILLALVLAVVIWIVAVQEENPIELGDFPDPIPVELRNLSSDAALMEEFDESVRLTLRAPRSSWEDLRADKFTAWVDLGALGPGDYDAEVHVTCTDPSVHNIQSRPASVPVYLKQYISRTVPVQIRLYGSAALGYELLTGANETTIEPANVTVAGPAPMVEQVHRATVDIYLRDVKEAFVGTRRVIARQASDELVGFVSIEPSMVEITIPVVQKTGFAEVAVRSVLTGNVGVGYWVSNITVDPATMTLVGDPAVISQIGSFVQTLPLDISGATGDIVERMPLRLPEGASPVGIQGVLVTVNVQPQPGSLIVSRRVVVRGLSPELTAAVSPEEVNVTLFGPLPRLNALADEDVYVYADLIELGAGQHRVNLTYLVPEGLQVMSISPSIADIEIWLPTPTPYPTATTTPSPTPTLSETITGTQTVSGTQGITTTVTPTGTVPADRETAPSTRGAPTPMPTLPSPAPVATPTEEKRSS